MKFILLLNIFLLMFFKSLNHNSIKFTERKTHSNNYLLYNLTPKYQAECIKVLSAPPPIIRRKNLETEDVKGKFILVHLTHY